MRPDLFTGFVGTIYMENCTFEPINWDANVLQTVIEFDPAVDEVAPYWTWRDLAEYRRNEALALIEAPG